jgi:hypothetical protein
MCSRSQSQESRSLVSPRLRSLSRYLGRSVIARRLRFLEGGIALKLEMASLKADNQSMNVQPSRPIGVALERFLCESATSIDWGRENAITRLMFDDGLSSIPAPPYQLFENSGCRDEPFFERNQVHEHQRHASRSINPSQSGSSTSPTTRAKGNIKKGPRRKKGPGTTLNEAKEGDRTSINLNGKDVPPN